MSNNGIDALPMDVIANNIYNVLNKGNCVAWVGSGLSICAGYPDWQSTIHMLCAACGYSASEISDDVSRLMVIADNCRDANRNAYEEKLAELFGNIPATTRRAYRKLLSLPFAHYVTTNFDPLFADAADDEHDKKVIERQEYPRINPLKLDTKEPRLFHLHGLARENGTPCGANLVFTASDFAKAYDRDMPVRIFVVQLLMNFSVLFIGCGLHEPSIQHVFNRVAKVRDHLGLQARINESYMLISSSDLDEKTNDDLRNMGVNPLVYRQSSNDYREIEEVLEEIRGLYAEHRPLRNLEVPSW